MTTFAERLEANMAPWASADLDRYLRSVASMFQPVATIAQEEGSDGSAGYIPPYGNLFNPATCPKSALPYLAMFVGVSLPVGGSEAEWRELVKAESGLLRGTLQSLEAACKRVLGVSPFTIEERTAANGTEDAYHLNVLVGTGKATQALYNEIGRA